MKYYYVYKNMGITISGSFSKDKTAWLLFEPIEKAYFEAENRRPFGATKSGVFIQA